MVHPNSLGNLIASQRKPRPRINAVMQHRCLEMLVDGATKQEIEDETGLSTAAIRHYIQALHKPAVGRNLVYIADYLEDLAGRRTVKQFKWGPGKKDIQFQHLTAQEKNVRYRAGLKRRELNRCVLGVETTQTGRVT